MRLPGDTRPTSEALALTIDPQRDGFSGVVDIAVTLDKPRSVIWLHGNGLHFSGGTRWSTPCPVMKATPASPNTSTKR